MGCAQVEPRNMGKKRILNRTSEKCIDTLFKQSATDQLAQEFAGQCEVVEDVSEEQTFNKSHLNDNNIQHFLFLAKVDDEVRIAKILFQQMKDEFKKFPISEDHLTDTLAVNVLKPLGKMFLFQLAEWATDKSLKISCYFT